MMTDNFGKKLGFIFPGLRNTEVSEPGEHSMQSLCLWRISVVTAEGTGERRARR